MQKTNIVIPNPCKANWEKMTPDSNGKFCDSCSKTVVDFTSMTTDQVVDYFSNRENEKICGHFKSTQVEIPRPKHHQFLVDLYSKVELNLTIPFIKTITLSSLSLCMTIVGCNNNSATGEKMPKDTIQQTKTVIDTTVIGDTIIYKQVEVNNTDEVLTGEVCVKKDTIKK